MNKIKFILSKFSYLIIIFILFFNFLINTRLFAQDAPEPLDILEITGSQAGYNTPTGEISDVLDTTIGLIITVVLGFLGVIFLALIIYSGFQWMTAGGNEETITKAKKRLTNATIGLIIVLAGYIISYFIITQLYNITTEPGAPGGGGQP